MSSLILGVIQGLGEFLPISSSGHLILVRSFLNINDQGLGFDVALHFGTLVAVTAFFRKGAVSFAKGAWQEIRGKQKPLYVRRAAIVILATIPGAAAGFFLERQVESVFRDSKSVALMLGAYAVLLFAADRFSQRKKLPAEFNNTDLWVVLTPVKAFLIGVSQALAVIPGTSRSGSTITAGLFLGLDRRQAATFSFLLSLPIIAGAFVAELPQLITVSETNLVSLLLGMASSAIVGFLSIKYMLQYLTNHRYDVFVWYRIILAALIIITI